MSAAGDAVLLVRVAASLLVVILLALLAARFARRGLRGHGELQVCERIGLTREASAAILEVGGRRLLVGVGPSQVTLLADLGTVPPGLTPDGLHPELPHPSSDELPDAGSAPPGPVGDLPMPRSPAGPTARPRRRAEVAAESVPDSPPDIHVHAVPLSRKARRELSRQRRRLATPPTQRGTGSVLDPRTWHQGLEALRDLTARRG